MIRSSDILAMRAPNLAAQSSSSFEGWRSPCYLLADRHVESMRDLFEGTDWERYGTDRDPRCANCLMHCGYEASTILDAMSRPKDLLALARG